LRLGTPDHWFVHEKGLITKALVRAFVLSMLRLEKHHTLWDLGAGSGSVGLEATLLLPQGLVYAVEKNAERIRQIRANAEKFKVENLTAVHIDMPDGLDRLPRPHRVFIGGGGNVLPGILEKAAVFLEHGDLIVVNAVLLETLTMAVKRLEEMKFKTSVTQIQVSQSRKMPWGQYMESLNPVWIIVGEKEK
jgi:precorrin-6Y C5,15-methyltransferase (decarboxylating)